MSEKETSREEIAASTPSPEETTGRAAHPAEEAVKRPADQFHARQVEMYKQSLATEGETAYLRWGMPLFHSLSDDEAEAQRLALGIAPVDALDFYNQGCQLVNREDFAGALTAFEQAAQLDPTLGEAVYNKAMALERMGDLAAARQTWQAYLEKFGENEDAGEVKLHIESLNQA